MTVISKADLARELGVTRARVSQFVKSGLPVREDGKIDRENALEYLRLYKTSRSGSDKGPSRAKLLLATGPQNYAKPEKELQPDWITRRWSAIDGAVVQALKDLVVKSRPTIAVSAIEAGHSVNDAYVLTKLLQENLLAHADRILEKLGVPGWVGGASHGLRMLDHGPEPQWRVFADELGQPFDRDGCEAVYEALPVMREGPRFDWIIGESTSGDEPRTT